MATVAFDEWLPMVLPLVPGCPEPLAINAIRNACIEFCSDTNWWQGDHSATLAAADLPYDFNLSAGVHLAQIMSAEIDGVVPPMAITSIQELTNKIPDWRSHTGQPRAVFQSQPGVVTTYPLPAGTDSYDFVFRLSYTPLRSATTIEDIVYEAWQEEIAAGALQRLMEMAGQPWSNADGAKQNGATYAAAFSAATVETAKSYGRQNQQIQFRRG